MTPKVTLFVLSPNRSIRRSTLARRRGRDLDRPNADRHLAELQLRVLWEEILDRFEDIEVQEEPERTFSSFVHGYTSLPVTVTRH